MAARPFVTGMLTIAMAATAAHVAGGPSAAPGMSQAPAAVVQMQEKKGATGTMKASWSDAMDRDPEGAGKANAEEELQAALCETIALTNQSCPARKGAGGGGEPKDESAEAPEVMFAILPDPVHTHLALWFDRSVDALEDALADSGWDYEKHWMPWTNEPGTEGGSVKLKDSEQGKLFRAGQEKYPGVIVFRPQSPESRKTEELQSGFPKHGGEPSGNRADHPLVVFVIGDSPTAGINAAQFREAVRRFNRIAPQQEVLNIAGPNFTGSGPSLRTLLGEAKGGALSKVAVHVASGSISDDRCSDLLPGGVQDSVRRQCEDLVPAQTAPKRKTMQTSPSLVPGPDTFVSFDVDFSWEQQQIEEFLHEKGGIEYKDMALLNEDESGFGTLGRVGQSHRGSKGELVYADEILSLTFPRNISHLRSAYQKNGVWGFAGSAGSASSVSLTLDFEESHGSDDSVTEFANKQMPVSQEAMLGQVTSILEQRQIRAVVVSATDVLDQLFVAQILARQAPNVLVVIRGTDVLFLRSGDGGVYHNMYAVSPWPLLPKNYFWSQSGVRLAMRSFPSDRAQGFYTATRYLVTDHHDLRVVQDYNSPFAPTGRPPLWFLNIAHGGYWPISLLPDQPDYAEPPGPPIRRASMNLPVLPQLFPPVGITTTSDRPALTQLLFLFAGCLLSLLHLGKCLNVSVLQGVATRYAIGEETVRRPKLLLQMAISVVGLLISCMFWGPTAGFGIHGNFFRAPLFVGTWALALALGSSFLELISPAFDDTSHQQDSVATTWRERMNQKRPGLTRLLFKVLVSLPLLAFPPIMVAIWGFFWELIMTGGTGADGVRAFFVYRSSYFLSGASPVFPMQLAMAGVVVYLLSLLNRFTFGPDLQPRLPKLAGGIAHCPTERDMKPLVGMLAYPSPGEARRKKLGMVTGIAVVTLLIVLGIHLVPETFEGWRLNAVCEIALLLMLLALLWDLFMAAYLWGGLKSRCMEALESSAIRNGFGRIGGFSWKDLWLMPPSHLGLSQFRTFSRAMEQAGRHVMEEELTGAEGAELSTTMMEMAEAQRLAANPLHGSHARERATFAISKSFGMVQDAMAKAAERILGDIWFVLHFQTDLITGGGEKEKKTPAAAGKKEVANEGGPTQEEVAPRELTHEIKEEWVALLYLHFIRMVLIQIRSRLITAATLYILLVWALTCYPYLNRHSLAATLSVLFAVLAITATGIYASINRDPILNRVTGSRAESFDIDFYIRAASMVGVPLLGLIASQFPELSSFLFSWIEPGMAAVK